MAINAPLDGDTLPDLDPADHEITGLYYALYTGDALDSGRDPDSPRAFIRWWNALHQNERMLMMILWNRTRRRLEAVLQEEDEPIGTA